MPTLTAIATLPKNKVTIEELCFDEKKKTIEMEASCKGCSIQITIGKESIFVDSQTLLKAALFLTKT